jgi:hypothetical protein
MLVVEPAPLAEVFDGTIGRLALADNALDALVRVKLFFLAFAIDGNRFGVFSRETWLCQPCLIGFVALNIVVDSLEAFKALQKLVGFISVVEMREVLPLDVVPL